MEDVFVDDDRSVVDVSADPELIGKVGTGDVLAEETEPRDLRRDDGTRRQNGADLIAHGGTAGLSEYFPNGCEGAGVEAELYDIDDVLHVEFGHVGFDAVCGCARVYGVEFAVGVDEDDVVVVLGELRYEIAYALNDVCLGNAVEEAHEVVVEENKFSLWFVFVGTKELMDLLPELRCGDVAEVVRPRVFEHLLKCQRCNSKKTSDAGVGVGNDRPALEPLFFALHHNVPVGYRFRIVEELLIVPSDAWGCLSFHVFFDILGGFVQEEERLLVHPCVERCLVVDVRAIYHQVGVGMVLVVDDVVVGKGGEEVLDESMCEARLVSLLLLVLSPLLFEKRLEVLQNTIVVGK